MKKVLKIILIILLVIIIVPLIGFGVLHLISSDSEAVDDADLIPVINSVSEDNGFFDYVESSKNLIRSEHDTNKIIDFLLDKEGAESFDDEIIEELLEENEKALISFEKIAGADVFQNPEFENLDELNYGLNISNLYISDLTEITRLYTIKTLYEFKEGDELKALNMSYKLIEIGSLIKDSYDTIANYLIGGAAEHHGYKAMAYILSHGDFTERQLAQYANRIKEFEDGLEGLINSYKVEYVMEKNTVDFISMQTDDRSIIESILMNHNFYFRLNDTKQLLADNIKLLIENAKKETYEEVIIQEYEFQNGFIEVFITSNGMGKTAYRSFLMNDFNDQMRNRTAQNRAIQAFVEYQNTGEFSQIDPFDGESLRYDEDENIFYSVGKDLVDDGGDAENDIVVKF